MYKIKWKAVLFGVGLVVLNTIAIWGEEVYSGEEIYLESYMEEDLYDNKPFHFEFEEEVRTDIISAGNDYENGINSSQILLEEKSEEVYDAYSLKEVGDNENELTIVGSSSGKCGDSLIWTMDYRGPSNILTISGNGEMYNFSNGESYGWDSEYIDEVVILEGVTSIGDYAFADCYSLDKITIPNSVTSIGKYAFHMCETLKTITIPDSVTYMGDYVFDRCFDLLSVTIPSGVTSLGEGAFYMCGITSISIPESVTSIGSLAFGECDYLQEISIPNNVEVIGDLAFKQCESLTNIILPNSLKYIGDSAFSSCYNLQSITIPNSVITIGEGAFVDCDNLESAIISNSVTIIDVSLFYSCDSLTSVLIPDSVKSIEENAFESCESLTYVTIGKSVEFIGESAFDSCSKLKEVEFLGNAPTIKPTSFLGVNATVYYPNNSTWTSEIRKNYGGNLSWASLDISTTIIGCYNSVKGADISWKKVEGATGYILYRKRSADGLKKAATIKNNSTTQYFDGDIKDNCWGRVYTYYVCPLYGRKEGPKSNEVTLQRLAPMQFTRAKNIDGKKISLKWTCTTSSNKANGYELQYAATKEDLYAGKGRKALLNGRNILSRASTKPGVLGQTYYFRIRAYVLYTNSKTGKQTKTWSQYSDVVFVKITK